MKTALLFGVSLCLMGIVPTPAFRGQDAARRERGSPVAPAATPAQHTDPALEKLFGMVGGIWVNVPQDSQRAIRIEFRYERALGGRAVRAVGVIGRGMPNAVETEAFFGWDPARKHVYYIDFHGAQTVYKGTIKAVGDALETEFETIVGAPAPFRSRTELPDKDTIVNTIFGMKEDRWVELHRIHLKRQR